MADPWEGDWLEAYIQTHLLDDDNDDEQEGDDDEEVPGVLFEDVEDIQQSPDILTNGNVLGKGRVQNKKAENIMNLALFLFGPSLHP